MRDLSVQLRPTWSLPTVMPLPRGPSSSNILPNKLRGATTEEEEEADFVDVDAALFRDGENAPTLFKARKKSDNRFTAF